MTRTTKIVLSVLVGLIAVGVAAGIWFFFITGQGKVAGQARSFLFFPGGELGGGAGTPSAPSAPGATATTPENKLTQIIKDPVIGATLTKDEKNILFFRRAGGNLFRAGLDGQNEEHLSQLTIVGISQVDWAPAKDIAAVSYIDEQSQVKRFLASVGTTTTSFLPNGITSLAWAPADDVLAYTTLTSNGTKASTYTIKTKSTKNVFSDEIPDWRVAWKDKATLLLATPPTYLVSDLALLVPLGKSPVNFVSLAGIGILPNATDTIAVSGTDANGAMGALALFNGKGKQIGTTGVATLAEKCAWNRRGDTLYCAVPSNPPTSALPDDWYRGKVLFNDGIVKIDGKTGAAKGTVLDASSLDAVDLFLDSSEHFLFFRNKGDSSLWRLDLTP